MLLMGIMMMVMMMMMMVMIPLLVMTVDDISSVVQWHSITFGHCLRIAVLILFSQFYFALNSI